MVVSPTFWRGKKVFLTGHTGFKGAWLSLWLTKLGANVRGYSLEPPSTPSLFELAAVASRVSSVTGDVRNAIKLKSEAESFQPEIVVHMAAQSLVRASYRDPVGTYSTNVMGTVNVLETMLQLESVKVVLNVTSDKCYENSEQNAFFVETDPMGGADPYSSSKGCAELVTSAYLKSFYAGKKALASARAGNVLGGGDWASDRIIPDCVRALERHDPIVMRNPEAVRPWQHVLDPLRGYLLLCEALWKEPEKFSSGWNFGPASEQPVRMVVNRMIELWGAGECRIESAELRESRLLKLDSSKARGRLGWSSALDIDQTMTWTVEWYKGVSNGRNAAEMSLEQIEKYEGITS